MCAFKVGLQSTDKREGEADQKKKPREHVVNDMEGFVAQGFRKGGKKPTSFNTQNVLLELWITLRCA